MTSVYNKNVIIIILFEIDKKKKGYSHAKQNIKFSNDPWRRIRNKKKNHLTAIYLLL